MTKPLIVACEIPCKLFYIIQVKRIFLALPDIKDFGCSYHTTDAASAVFVNINDTLQGIFIPMIDFVTWPLFWLLITLLSD